MALPRVLVVAGTHGNEVNAPWLLQQWQANPDLIDAAGLAVQRVIGNPEALHRRCRYVDRDLNRCFLPEQLEQGASGLEFQRAGELLHLHGPSGEQCKSKTQMQLAVATASGAERASTRSKPPPASAPAAAGKKRAAAPAASAGKKRKGSS